MADDHHARRARPVLLFGEEPSEHRPHAEGPRKVRRDDLRLNALDVAIRGDVEPGGCESGQLLEGPALCPPVVIVGDAGDRKSTRLNSSHLVISYAVFCLKKKKNRTTDTRKA